MLVGITGATGYIGRELLASLPADWQAVSLGRRPVASAHRHADLARPMPDGLLDGLDAVIHLAADTGNGGISLTQELAFARDLALAARRRRIPLLFLSSQASSFNAPTNYGLTKAAIEAAIVPLGATVIRPGMVYGGEERGLFGVLCALIRLSPVRPLLLPAPQVQPIHVEDLCGGIIATIADPALHGATYAIASEPMSFNRFLASIAQDRVRRRRLPLPTPVPLLRIALHFSGWVFGSRLGPGRLDSLLSLPTMETASDLKRLKLVPRMLRDGMSRSGSPRRRLLEEGRYLATSLLGRRAIPLPTLRRYLLVLKLYGHTVALDLPRLLRRHPWLLAALDRPAWRRAATKGSLAWRMDMMCRLCESDPRLSAHYIGGTNRTRWDAIADGVRACAAELQVVALHPLARRLAGRQ